MKSVLISIIVPIYNVSMYLQRCIDSLINQTYSNLEIILVDDGSTDNSSSICDEYAAKDSRIKVIHKKNGGLVSARKMGILAATGELIAYVDGDDWVEPDMYEKLNEKVKAENVDIVVCARYEDTKDIRKEVFQGFSEGKYDKKKLLSEIYPRMIVNDFFFEWGINSSLCDKLFKKELILPYQLGVNDSITWGEDAACVYPSLLKADSIYIYQKCLYHYRQIPNSMSKQIPNYEEEKCKYQIMYRYTMNKLAQDIAIYDLREQWTKYVLFLMTARADGLYEGYEKLNYLYPFKSVKKNEKIVLYGAGTYGRRLYSYLMRTSFCTVVLWADKNYIELQKEGLDVCNPECIRDCNYDHIVVAITYAKARQGAVKALNQKYGYERVETIDVGLIISEESKKNFGLN